MELNFDVPTNWTRSSHMWDWVRYRFLPPLSCNPRLTATPCSDDRTMSSTGRDERANWWPLISGPMQAEAAKLGPEALNRGTIFISIHLCIHGRSPFVSPFGFSWCFFFQFKSGKVRYATTALASSMTVLFLVLFYSTCTGEFMARPRHRKLHLFAAIYITCLSYLKIR